MREILPGILTWPWFSERQGYDFNGYLLRLPDGNVCVDPVEMTDDVLREIAAEGVLRIVLTNRNHFRASMKVKERTGASIAIHPADAAFARAKGTVVDAGLQPAQAGAQRREGRDGPRMPEGRAFVPHGSGSGTAPRRVKSALHGALTRAREPLPCAGSSRGGLFTFSSVIFNGGIPADSAATLSEGVRHPRRPYEPPHPRP